MALQEEKRSGGTVLRGSDGQIYFIRDEVLPAFKVEGEGLQRLQKEIGGKREMEAKPAEGLGSSTYLRADLLDKDPPAWTVHMARVTPVEVSKLRASTIMCPWFC
jgi:hypothetical protein